MIGLSYEFVEFLLSTKAALDTVGDTEMNKSDSRPVESSQSIKEDRHVHK